MSAEFHTGAPGLSLGPEPPHDDASLLREGAEAIRRTAAPRFAQAGSPHDEESLRGLAAWLGRVDAAESGCMLSKIRTGFGLSDFETCLLVLCAAYELDGPTSQHLAQGESLGLPTYPCLATAYYILPGPHWEAILPQRPLRRWGLVHVEGEGVLINRRLRLDEQVLHLLMGSRGIDQAREAQTGAIAGPGGGLTEGDLVAVQELVEYWGREHSRRPGRSVQLVGDRDQAVGVAARAWSNLGVPASPVPVGRVPEALPEREAFLRGWEREAILGVGALVLEVDVPDDPGITERVNWVIDHARFRLTITTPRPLLDPPAGVLRIDIERPARGESVARWREALRDDQISDDQLLSVAGQFHLGLARVDDVCEQYRAAVATGRESGFDLLWDIAARAAEPSFGPLAERLDSRDAWDDLVVGSRQRRLLEHTVSFARQRASLMRRWGIGEGGARGGGVAVLFSGESGTGKTMAAGCVAVRLRLPLYRVDLAGVVSKYIGETEKNLSRIFDAAESGGAVLLFDEADALFGKRSEVSSSHDRYSNIEINHLLQKLEAFRGLAILTTNHRDNIDTAFARRFQFVVHFARPSPTLRGRLWSRAFPEGVPTSKLDMEALAQIDLTGAQIRNASLHAAARAIDASGPVTMTLVRDAIEHELIKADQAVSVGDLPC